MLTIPRIAIWRSGREFPKGDPGDDHGLGRRHTGQTRHPIDSHVRFAPNSIGSRLDSVLVLDQAQSLQSGRSGVIPTCAPVRDRGYVTGTDRQVRSRSSCASDAGLEGGVKGDTGWTPGNDPAIDVAKR